MHTQKKDRWHPSLLHLLTLGLLLLLASACSGESAATHMQTHTLAARTPQIDWPHVDAAMGKAGSVMPGGVHRYASPEPI